MSRDGLTDGVVAMVGIAGCAAAITGAMVFADGMDDVAEGRAGGHALMAAAPVVQGGRVDGAVAAYGFAF
jgi:hypothetical protein